MSAATRDPETARWTRPEEETPDANTLHLVHLDCQVGAPFKTSMCRMAMDEGDRNEDPNGLLTLCELCEFSDTCPVCGRGR